MNIAENLETIKRMCTTLSLFTLFECKIDVKDNCIYIISPPMVYLTKLLVAETQIFMKLMNAAKQTVMFVNEDGLPVIVLKF